MKKRVVKYKKEDVDFWGDGTMITTYTEYVYVLISSRDISEYEYNEKTKKIKKENGEIN